MKDASVGVVQNARLEPTETNISTGCGAATTDAGNYAFADFPPGVYQLTVEDTSLKKTKYCRKKFVPK